MNVIKDVTSETSEEKKKSVERTLTPESGYGTDVMGEFEEKVENANELSEETPVLKPKRRRDDFKPAPLLREKPDHNIPSKAPPPPSSVKENAKMSVSILRETVMVYPNVDTSFLEKYPPLKSERDWKAYEVIYLTSYQKDYAPIHTKIENRANEWRRLEASLLDTSDDAIADDIKAKMEKIGSDSHADKDVPYYKYLHEKLAHLKRMGKEWHLKNCKDCNCL